MKKYLIISILIAHFSVLLYSSEPSFLPGVVIVKFSNPKSKALFTLNDKKKYIEGLTGNTKISISPMFEHAKAAKAPGQYDLSGIYRITFDTRVDVNSMVDALKNAPLIAYVQPYWLPEELYVPNDPLIGQQYHLPLVKAFEAYDITHGDTNFVIGIVDTGTDFYHADLLQNIKINYNDPVNGVDDDLDGFIDNYRGWDLGDDDNNAQYGFSNHGIYVAGLAAAVTNNATGVAGVGFQTKFMPVKVIDNRGQFSKAWEGIVYAADHGCQVINCSWGSTVKSPLADDVVAYATAYRKCLVVAACGNERTDKPYYPAACEGVLSVTATTAFDLKWFQATYGITVDIGAPGEAIYTTVNNNSYAVGWGGTSFSSPIVAGAAALVWSQNPAMLPEQVAERLRITADIIDTLPDNLFYRRQMGYGRLNILKALTRTDLPSIRITDMKTSAPVSGIFAGDTLEVSIKICDYLAQITSTAIKLTSESEYVSLIKNTWLAGKMGTLETKSNEQDPFKLVISENTPDNTPVRLWFDFKDQGYSDYQAFDLVINPSFMDVKAGDIMTTLTSNGKFGIYDFKNQLGTGLRYKQSYNLLADAGLILGSAGNEVASAFESDGQFSTLERIDSTKRWNYIWKAKTSFVPENIYQGKLLIEQHIQMNFKTLPSVVLSVYNVTNQSLSDIEHLKLGIYANWNLLNLFANHATFYPDEELIYTSFQGIESSFAGICLLNDQQATPYIFDRYVGGMGGVDITDGFSDNEKWFAMTNSRLDSFNEGDSVDVATMLTSDYFNLPVNQTINVGFALIVADTYYDLVYNARQARELFQTGGLLNPGNPSENFIVYPNPVNRGNPITINLLEDRVHVKIFNQLGVPVFDKSDFISGKHSILTDQWDQGVYFIMVDDGRNRSLSKIVVIN